MSLQLFMKGVANDLESALIRVCPVDKGGLRLSVKVVVDGNQIKIYMLDYWKHLEYGTNAHIIIPKETKALKFKGKDGKTVFTKMVRHPGTKANPFIRNTLYHKLPKIIEENSLRFLGSKDAAVMS